MGESIHLHQVCSYKNEPVKATISMQELMTNWVVTKTEPPKQMQGGQCRPTSLGIETQKSSIFKAIVDLDAKHVDKHGLTFWRRPDEVRTKGSIIKAGQLTIVPIAPLMNIHTKNNPSNTGVSLGKHDVAGVATEFWAIPVAKPLAAEGGTWPEESFVAAYWWINTTHIKTMANMCVQCVVQNGFDIPVLKNNVDLQPFSKLWVYVAPNAKVAPLQNIRKEPDAEKEKPSKKQRKA